MRLGLPYMGSKRKIAKDIVDYMIQNNPNAKYFWDLFGGGGAISFELLKRGKTVFYNELNTGIVELLEKIRDDGVTPEFYEWVDRETFNKHKEDKTWHGGLLATCWSFGNNQRDYLYAKHIEEEKRLLHEIIVNKCEISRLKFQEVFGVYIEDFYLKADNIQKRRLEVMGVVKSTLKGLHLKHLEHLEHLERLQHLERLERLERLQRLNILNLNAFDVEITTQINETIIYLDPPYKGTSKYQEDISYDELYEYINKSPYKIYMSSYEAPFECVFTINHRSTLSATENNKVVEKLFCNQTELKKGVLFWN